MLSDRKSLLFSKFFSSLTPYFSPFFDRIDIQLPPRPGQTHGKPLTIVSLGGSRMRYVKSVEVNGVILDKPTISHDQIADGGIVVFTMSSTIEEWGNDPEVLQSLGFKVVRLKMWHMVNVSCLS